MPLRCAWAGHPSRCLCAGETLPMWKPTTGEPYAGEPHVRFGGRGGATPLPDPYRAQLVGDHGFVFGQILNGHSRMATRLVTENAAVGSPVHFSMRYGLWVSNAAGGNIAAALEHATNFLSVAQSQPSPGPLLVAHRILAHSLM
jgi:hypothetical protein